MQTITFIGNGNMALSIAQGLKTHYKIEVVGRDLDKLKTFEKQLEVNVEKHLIHHFDTSGKTLLLCIKPNNVEEVSTKLKGQARLLLSVLAGTSIDKLQTHFNTTAIVRTMPNLAASVGDSMTTMTGDTHYQEEAQTLLNSIGETLWLDSEKELDIATALAGSGPAYLALIAEALADGAVKQGLKREYAMKTMRGLFKGFGEVIQETHPAVLKDAVMSPGGTTAAGYSALETGNVRASCIHAIEAAYNQTKIL